jgi:hypothetical protein
VSWVLRFDHERRVRPMDMHQPHYESESDSPWDGMVKAGFSLTAVALTQPSEHIPKEQSNSCEEAAGPKDCGWWRSLGQLR